GWAPALAQAQCAKALNVAVQNGAAVNEKVRGKAEEYARADFKSGAVGGSDGGGTLFAGSRTEVSAGTVTMGTVTMGSGGKGDAGVPLYSSGGQIAAMQASANSNHQMQQQLQAVADSPTTQPEKR